MGFFANLLGRKSTARAPVRDVQTLAAGLAQPALQVASLPGVLPCAGRSWFLGSPALAPGTAWPQHAGRKLDFLACLDLAEIDATLPTAWLPRTGSLSFFYDLEKQPWGFDPKDRGSWAVIYRADSASAPSRECRALEYRKIRSYPPAERTGIDALALSDDEIDAFCELELQQTGVEFPHKVGGFPSLIQGDDLELSSQLASHDVYCGDSKGYQSDRGQELAPGAKDWRLLFQVASDVSLGFMWGDCGNLYFMIREQDARAGRFDQSWLLMQCF